MSVGIGVESQRDIFIPLSEPCYDDSMSDAVNHAMLRAWLTGRSIARGLPAPIPDHEGFRVDTSSDVEVRRWVFPHVTPRLIELGATIGAPGYLLKVCGTADELRGVLPDRWQIQTPGYFMRATEKRSKRLLPKGYAVEVHRDGMVTTVTIRTDEGEVAASGYAAETDGAFVYDRIITALNHRRKGLAGAMMTILRHTKKRQELPELLVATEDGRALYTNLGWRTISPYTTALVGEL